MTPTTEAGRALLDGLADAMGTTSDSALGLHGELFRGRVVDAVERGIAAIEAAAAAVERARLRAALEGLRDHEVELAERTDVGRDVRFDAAGRATAYGRVLALLDAPC